MLTENIYQLIYLGKAGKLERENIIKNHFMPFHSSFKLNVIIQQFYSLLERERERERKTERERKKRKKGRKKRKQASKQTKLSV